MTTTQQQTIKFFLNNQEIEATTSPELTALKLITEQLELTGTKESCSEGDCGACTIALGQWNGNQFQYHAINSCILPAVKLHGTHVITVEGLEQDNRLHLIQQMMLENHATQCGFCTPGIIMSLFCLLLENANPTQEEVFAALEGNLCRCTGYKTIFEATHATIQFLNKDASKIRSLMLLPYMDIIKQNLKKINPIISETLNSIEPLMTENYFIPKTLSELFSILNKLKGNCKILAGGTDLIVEANVQKKLQKNIIDISKIETLNFIQEKNNAVIIGANVTLTQLLKSKIINKTLPILVETISRMGSTQIRNIATLVGNIANASPVADGACALLALNTSLILESNNYQREVTIEKFFKDYKKTELKNSEIISKIIIPIPKGVCSFEKTSRRIAVDISAVCSTVNIQIQQGIIEHCRIAFGGVHQFPALAKKAAQALIGNSLSDALIEKVSLIAQQEFNPITDVRGSEQYRKTLIKNHLIKHLSNLMK